MADPARVLVVDDEPSVREVLALLFDIESVFLYPWAVAFRQLGLYGLVEMLLFILILFVGYAYLLKKRALEWD